MPIAVKSNKSIAPKPNFLLTSLAKRFVDVPNREIVPPITTAKDMGSITRDGEMRRR